MLSWSTDFWLCGPSFLPAVSFASCAFSAASEMADGATSKWPASQHILVRSQKEDGMIYHCTSRLDGSVSHSVLFLKSFSVDSYKTRLSFWVMFRNKSNKLVTSAVNKWKQMLPCIRLVFAALFILLKMWSHSQLFEFGSLVSCLTSDNTCPSSVSFVVTSSVVELATMYCKNKACWQTVHTLWLLVCC